MIKKQLLSQSYPMSKYYKADRQYPRLKKRIRDSGKWVWVYVYSFRGRDRAYTIGKVSLTQARKIAAGLQFAVAQGKDPQGEKLAERKTGTFAELHTSFVEGHAKKFNKSWEQPFRLVEHVLPKLGKLDVKSVTQADVLAALGKIEADGTYRQTVAAVSRVFSWGIETKVLQHNPCTGIKTKKINERERVCSDDELRLLWPRMSAPLKMISLTAARPGEILHMRFEHVRDGWWSLPGQPDANVGWPGVKNHQSHKVWMTQPVRELIGEGETGFVFARASRLSWEMQRLCQELNIKPKITPHDLRRTAATRLGDLGYEDPAIARILNHKSARRGPTPIYNRHPYAAKNQAMWEELSAHVLAVVEGRRETGTVTQLRVKK